MPMRQRQEIQEMLRRMNTCHVKRDGRSAVSLLEAALASESIWTAVNRRSRPSGGAGRVAFRRAGPHIDGWKMEKPRSR
jgi:hypothetical protein